MALEKSILISERDREEVRKYFDVNRDTIARDVEIIKIWISQQKHFPQNILDDQTIETKLLRNKFRVEATKIKLENYFTLRGLHKDFYENFEMFKPSRETVCPIFMPCLTKNYERIIICRLNNPDPELYDPHRALSITFQITEILQKYDYSLRHILIVDCKGASLAHLKHITPKLLADGLGLYQNAYALRVSLIAVLNAPSFLSIGLNMLKAVLTTKNFNKIKLYPDLGALYRDVEKDCLPREYGGNLLDIPTILSNWDAIFEEHQTFFKDNLKSISNEALRVGHTNNNDMFGIDGTFKKINLD